MIAGLGACPASGKYPWAVFSPQGPSMRELAVQALSSVEGGYDLLARSSTARLSAPPMACSTQPPARCARSARSAGDWTCAVAPARACGSWVPLPGTGHRRRFLSAGMLAQARSAHPDAGWVRADVRALPFAGVFDVAVSFGALGHFLAAERPPAIRRRVPRAAAWRGVRFPRLRRRRSSPQAGTGHCSGSTWPCGFVMPSGDPRSSCTTGPARCTRSAAT